MDLTPTSQDIVSSILILLFYKMLFLSTTFLDEVVHSLFRKLKQIDSPHGFIFLTIVRIIPTYKVHKEKLNTAKFRQLEITKFFLFPPRNPLSKKEMFLSEPEGKIVPIWYCTVPYGAL